ncbi:hypothetical protein IMSHALPRED_003763 [Imshaugia aleurites]|uniref:Uncharacterized protein n=1 Tax=Imshaugia aleurites TaxID=172621 RepID=A0A8H3F235_9LECA|nr:hypothetical protein IMSHALPRED_003763 [Imshaugia aleurites]
MASPMQLPLQTGSPRRLAISPDQPPSVQEFSHGLKNPTLPVPSPNGLEAPQHDKSTGCQLTVQDFLHGLRKSVILPDEPAEAPKLQSIASTRLEDLPFIDSAATVLGPGLFDPPESTPGETDSDQILSPSPGVSRLRYPSPKCADEQDVLMKIPKVTRTYTKKVKPVLLIWKDGSAISHTQSSTHERALLDGLVDDGSTEQLPCISIPETGPAERQRSVIPRKRKRQALQGIRQENPSEDNLSMVIREKKKTTKRKKRRAPVNELALVTRHSSSPLRQVRKSIRRYHILVSNRRCAHYTANLTEQKAYNSTIPVDSLNVNLDEQQFGESTSPNRGRNRESTKANVGKPVTRIRHEIIMPKQEVLAREGFKVPSTTPRAKKSPGWRLGSGFDGITLAPTTNRRPQTSRNRKVRFARTPCFLGRSPPKLELSSRLSPTRQSVDQSGFLNRQKDQGGPVGKRVFEPARESGTADCSVEVGLPHRAAETGRNPGFEQGASLTALLRPTSENDQSGTTSSSHHDGIVKGLVQLHSSQNDNLDASQAIREPSRSERNGWLKRRRVKFAVADEDEEEQLYSLAQRTLVNASKHRRGDGRSGLGTYFETLQAVLAVDKRLQALDGGGQTAPFSQRPMVSQQQDVFLDNKSDERSQRQMSDNAEVQGSPLLFSDSETDISASPLHAKSLSTSYARHHIEVPRTSEVPETQERPQGSVEIDYTTIEASDLDRHPCSIPVTNLDSGKYFSKAVQQLDSPDEVPHTITRRRSRRDPGQDMKDSQVMVGTPKGARHVSATVTTGGESTWKQEGSLELGVTPRLQRRMSNVPFRPPFKRPLR